MKANQLNMMDEQLDTFRNTFQRQVSGAPIHRAKPEARPGSASSGGRRWSTTHSEADDSFSPPVSEQQNAPLCRALVTKPRSLPAHTFYAGSPATEPIWMVDDPDGDAASGQSTTLALYSP